MSEADQAYYTRRAYQEQVHVELAARPEAKAVHQQLRDLYLVRAGQPITDANFTVHAHDAA